MATAASVSFDFEDTENIGPELRRCTIGTQGLAKTSAHLEPLRSLAKELKVPDNALSNAEYLATGYEDLVVILQEPSDREEEMLYKETLSNGNRSFPSAVDLLDQTLGLAFKNQRNVKNTIVLDVRPLRSRKIRLWENEENEKLRRDNDTMAYEAVKQMLDTLEPKVVVVCQCDKTGLSDGMPEYLVSSVREAGTAGVLSIKDGHKGIKISSFHPMYFTQPENSPMENGLRKHLFHATFVIAANALAGRTVGGFGVSNLRHRVLYGPCFSNGSRELIDWYGVWNAGDDASPELLERLRQLGLLPDLERSQLDELIKSYQREGMNQARIVRG